VKNRDPYAAPMLTPWRARSRDLPRRNRRACTCSGYVFRENDIILRLTVLGVDQIRIEPVGRGYRSQCDALGTIDSATYTRAPASR
jgi:hypothetical protein